MLHNRVIVSMLVRVLSHAARREALLSLMLPHL
jgi:hypothetical protein